MSSRPATAKTRAPREARPGHGPTRRHGTPRPYGLAPADPCGREQCRCHQAHDFATELVMLQISSRDVPKQRSRAMATRLLKALFAHGRLPVTDLNIGQELHEMVLWAYAVACPLFGVSGLAGHRDRSYADVIAALPLRITIPVARDYARNGRLAVSAV